MTKDNEINKILDRAENIENNFIQQNRFTIFRFRG